MKKVHVHVNLSTTHLRINVFSEVTRFAVTLLTAEQSLSELVKGEYFRFVV